jgi:hypothetical protein
MNTLRAVVVVFIAPALASMAFNVSGSDVVGTGNPAQDVANVQAAVDAGGTVRMWGIFDFTGMETGSPPRVITISAQPVDIVGVATGDGLATIRGGQSAFFVDAPGMDVTIERLNFIGQTATALTIASGGHVVVSRCQVESLQPAPQMPTGLSVAIGVGVNPGPVAFLEIDRNDIDVRAGTSDNTVGILVSGPAPAPSTTGSITASITRNIVRNASAHAIDLRNIGSAASADVERNDVTVITSDRSGEPSPTPSADRLIDGIRGLGTGLYAMRWNDIRIEHPNAAGVRLQGTSQAVVEQNEIAMAVPTSAYLGAQSAGVQVIRGSVDAGICRNTVSGLARTGVSLIGSPPTTVDGTVIALTDDASLAASFDDVEVGPGVLDTTIIAESGTISDLGSGTTIVRNANYGQLPGCGI